MTAVLARSMVPDVVMVPPSRPVPAVMLVTVPVALLAVVMVVPSPKVKTPPADKVRFKVSVVPLMLALPSTVRTLPAIAVVVPIVTRELPESTRNRLVPADRLAVEWMAPATARAYPGVVVLIPMRWLVLSTTSTLLTSSMM